MCSSPLTTAIIESAGEIEKGCQKHYHLIAILYHLLIA